LGVNVMRPSSTRCNTARAWVIDCRSNRRHSSYKLSTTARGRRGYGPQAADLGGQRPTLRFELAQRGDQGVGRVVAGGKYRHQACDALVYPSGFEPAPPGSQELHVPDRAPQGQGRRAGENLRPGRDGRRLELGVQRLVPRESLPDDVAADAETGCERRAAHATAIGDNSLERIKKQPIAPTRMEARFRQPFRTASTRRAGAAGAIGADIRALYWVNFAGTGDPNGAGLPVWPPALGRSAHGNLSFAPSVYYGCSICSYD
jgi:hypothetical protein